MKHILREPLLHFLLLGVAIFVAYGVVSRRPGRSPGMIVVTQGQIAAMVVGFTATWQRPPTSAELEGLIRDRVREEVYSREARVLGLDQDDLIIRRRLRQKMEFLTDDLVAQAQPTDDELRAYLQSHPDTFRVPRQFSFSQVYLNPEKHGADLARDAARLLAQLHQAGGTAELSALGDAFLLEQRFEALPSREVARLFGEPFAAQLDDLLPGQWQGPVESGYGVHLVFISERTDGRLPALAAVRDAVSREWTNARRLDANEKLYEAMLARYAVTIEPAPGAAEKQVEEAKAK